MSLVEWKRLKQAALKRLKQDAEEYLEGLDASICRKTVQAQEGGIRRVAMQPTTTAEKITLLARAYALSSHFAVDDRVVSRLATGQKRKATSKNLARVFLEALYPVGGPQSQKTLSRWTAAITYLRAQMVLPSEVESLGKQKGEGINKWTRLGAVRPSPSRDLSEPVVVTISKGPEPTHWKVWSSSQVRAVERALQNIEPEPTSTRKSSQRSSSKKSS